MGGLLVFSLLASSPEITSCYFCFSRRSAHKPFAHWWLGWGWWATELNGIHTKMWQSRSSKVMWLRPPCYFWSLVPRDKLSKRVEAPLNIMRCSRLANLSFHRTQEIQWIKHVCGCQGLDFSHFLKQLVESSSEKGYWPLESLALLSLHAAYSSR